MSEEKLSREEKKVLNDLKIITAISIGQDRNKELAKVLDTDKSFASKRVNQLCEGGLVIKEGEGKDVRYSINRNRVLDFLQSKVVLRWEKKEQVSQNSEESKSSTN